MIIFRFRFDVISAYFSSLFVCFWPYQLAAQQLHFISSSFFKICHSTSLNLLNFGKNLSKLQNFLWKLIFNLGVKAEFLINSCIKFVPFFCALVQQGTSCIEVIKTLATICRLDYEDSIKIFSWFVSFLFVFLFFFLN